MNDWRFRERFSEWLTEVGARTESIPYLIDAYCQFMSDEGFGIYRCNLLTSTIHPQMTAMRHVWFREASDAGPIDSNVFVNRRQYLIGEAMIDEVFFKPAGHQNPQFKASPFYRIETEGELYEPIDSSSGSHPYPLFDELAAKGCTGYFGILLRSFAGMLQMMGLATTSPNGLAKEEIDELRWSLGMLSLHLNTLIESSIKNTLVEVYLGRDPGQRVSKGMIAAGNVVGLEGAIWFSDIRDFTKASESMDAESLVKMLNDYFTAVVGTIYDQGGEILKYIGDAILAIFPSDKFPGPSESCRAALDAAAVAQSRLDALNEERERRGLAAINHGIGLHFGKAQYGNIGGAERLDFTLIGREVNIAWRIEGLTKPLEERLLCSQPFTEESGTDMELLGEFDLKGIKEKMAVYRPADQ
ncbi:MAG TPA: hypothetical protein DCS24_09680 [Erythrobacter sp.]|nr:hypothetical protein [Erythrobacter sp.]